jgi:CO/xanthine dehydrogenase Mo-binding subunit
MTSLDAPPMVTLFVGEDEDRCEGVGEIGAVAVGGAVAQAIENATSGVLGQLPMTPIRVLEALV